MSVRATAALVTMPDGTTLLIDGGGRPSFRPTVRTNEGTEAEPFEPDARSIGERSSRSIYGGAGWISVDYILATHADADHMDGLNDVARNFRRARRIRRARAAHATLSTRALQQTMTNEGVPVLLIGRGDTLRFGLWSQKCCGPRRARASLRLQTTTIP